MKFNYFADPHTCVALAGAEKLGYWLDSEHFFGNGFALQV